MVCYDWMEEDMEYFLSHQIKKTTFMKGNKCEKSVNVLSRCTRFYDKYGYIKWEHLQSFINVFCEKLLET